MFWSISMSITAVGILAYLLWRTVPLLNELRVTWQQERDTF